MSPHFLKITVASLALSLSLAHTAFGAAIDICLAVDSGLSPQATVEACSPLADDSTLPLPQQAAVLQQLGVAHRNLGNLGQSAIFLEQALALGKDNAGLLRMLAWTLREDGAFERSEDLLTRSLELEDHWQGHLSRCVVRQDQHEFASALEDCETALAQFPTEDAAFFTAHAHNALLNFERARAVALAQLPGADAKPRLAIEAVRACRSLGDDAQARTILDSALARWPEDEELQWLRDSLN